MAVPLAPTYCNGARRTAEPGGAKEAAIAKVSCSAGPPQHRSCRSELARDQRCAASGSVVFRHRGPPVRNGPPGSNILQRGAPDSGARWRQRSCHCEGLLQRGPPPHSSCRSELARDQRCAASGSVVFRTRIAVPLGSYGFKVAAVWIRSKRAPMYCSGCVPDSGATEPQATPWAPRDGARSAAPAPCKPSAGSDERSSAAG